MTSKNYFNWNMKRARSSSKTGGSPAKKRRTDDAQVAKIVRKEIRKNTDWRYTDNSQVANNSNTTGTVSSLLANLVRGDNGFNNFQGNEVTPQGLLVKYYIHTSQVRNVVRVMLIQWFDDVVPVPLGILQNITTGLGPLSATSVTNKRYIKVLYDMTHQFAPTAGGDTTVVGEGVTDPVTVYIPGKRMKNIRYQSTSNTVQDGCLYLLHISDDLAAPSPQITWYSRLTFPDA